jgi:hypothetical protein
MMQPQITPLDSSEAIWHHVHGQARDGVWRVGAVCRVRTADRAGVEAPRGAPVRADLA